MSWPSISAPSALAIAVAAFALLAAACSGGSEATPTSVAQSTDPAPAGGAGEPSSNADTPSDDQSPGADSEAGDAPDSPSGEAVLVSADYQHPSEYVDNTGAYLPANGKPTVVFVDAIW